MSQRQSIRGSRVARRCRLALLATLAGVLAAWAGPHVRVGVYQNSPKVGLAADGRPEGIFIDLIQAIASEEGWTLEYVPGTWAEGLDRLAAGQIDLMPDVALTPERAEHYAFHHEPVLSDWYQVYARRGSGIRSLPDLNGRRVTLLERSIQQEALSQAVLGFDLSITLVPLPDYPAAFAAVAQGQAEAVITNRFYGAAHSRDYRLEDTAIIFNPTRLYFAAPVGSPRHLRDALDHHLRQLKKDPDSVYYRSLRRWTSEKLATQLPPWLEGLAVASAMLLLASLFWSMVLKRQVSARTRELAQRHRELQNTVERLSCTEQTLRQERQQLRDILEFLPDATFVIDEYKHVVAWNRACEILTGVGKEAVLGRGDYAYAEPFYHERRPILIDLLDLPAQDLEARYSYVRRQADTITAETWIASLRGGQGAWLWGVAAPLFDQEGRRRGAIEVIRDVSEQKRIEQTLHESERKYRELVEHANSIILRWTHDGRITFLNEYGQRFFGYTAEEIIGRPVLGTIVPECETDGRDLQQLMTRICANPREFEHNINQNTRRNGERVWIEWTNKVVLDEQGQVVQILSVGTDISARQQAEEALRESEERLRLLGDNLPDSYVYQYRYCDGRPCFLYLSAGVERVHGISVAAARRDAAVLHSQIAPSQLPLLLAAEAVSLRDMSDLQMELPMQRADGQWRWLAVRSRPRRRADGEVVWDGVATDITASKEAARELDRYRHELEDMVGARTAELHAANEQLSAILQATNVGIVVLRDRVIQHCNARLESIFGYAPGELANRPCRIWYPDEAAYVQGGDPVAQEIRQGRTPQREQWLVRKDGSRFLARLTARALFATDPAQGMVVVIDDITQARADELALRHARERAEAADRLKSAFLATMSHELRTPLNSIIGFTGILLQELPGPLNPEQRKQLGMVRDSARHLLALINDVLDISKIEAGQLEVAAAPFDLPAAIARVTGLVTPLAEKRGLALRCEIAPEIGTLVSDSRRVEQVLLNLLNNAIKFTERGTVTLTAGLLAAPGQPPVVSLAVTDTGIGIKPEDLDTLFQPFRQVDTGLARQHEGTGLGLAICRRLAELLGGRMRVASEWGHGSTFALELPLKGSGS